MQMRDDHVQKTSPAQGDDLGQGLIAEHLPRHLHGLLHQRLAIEEERYVVHTGHQIAGVPGVLVLAGLTLPCLLLSVHNKL